MSEPAAIPAPLKRVPPEPSPASETPRSRSASPPPLPPQWKPTHDELAALTIAVTPDPDSDEPPTISDVLTSRTSVSFCSSVAIHLLLWCSIFFVTRWLGVNWTDLLDIEQPPIQASLGEEDIVDDLAKFEVIGEVDASLDTPASNLESLAAQLQQSDSAWLKSSADDVWRSFSESKVDGDGAGVLLKVPASGLAVTKGSFTAFTIPAHPRPRETYSIVIEVRLKNDVKKYRASDLSGEVKGSDNYTQKLPFDPRAPNASGYPAEDKRIKPLKSDSILDVVDNKVQIVVKVPGAARLVKDTIRISSRRLKETQELTLVFGQNPDDNNLDDPKDEDGAN